jgi:SAM-dependent MidA family methyltransferase
MQLQLPEPSLDAQIASRNLQQLIADEIKHQSGWISFARYMELALYAPQGGYYSGGSEKLGKDGDFTTAPEISPLFGQTLAKVIDEILRQSAPQIMEFGAGSGKLAHAILTELAAMGVTVHRYYIIEVSGELRARQEALLQDFPQVRWLEQWPNAFSGAVLGNEVLDAMPVQLVIKTQQGWKPRQFVYEDKPCDPQLIAQIPQADELPDDYLTEVHPISIGFMGSLAQMLVEGYRETGKGGAALLVDYGFPAHEYYLAQRSNGTLMCHYRHHAHDDPFYLPGLQDITAHVDFTAMAQAAIENGLDMLGYTSQAAFLMNAGIGELLLRTSPSDPLRYLPQANALQKLVSPAEMGELFKVLIVGTHVHMSQAFDKNDRSGRL